MDAGAIAKRLRLPKVAQLGFVVADMDKAIAWYKDTAGVRPWMLMDERPEPCLERGKEVHPVLRIALAYSGPMQMELIQVTEGESFHLARVKDSPGGVHHFGFLVGDLERRLTACRAMGVDVLQRGTIRDTGMVIDYAYLDTLSEAGTYFELIRWRFGPLPMPVNSLSFRLLARLGGSTVFKGRVIG